MQNTDVIRNVLPFNHTVRNIASNMKDKEVVINKKEAIVLKVQYLASKRVRDKDLARFYGISEPSVRDYKTRRRFSHIDYKTLPREYKQVVEKRGDNDFLQNTENELSLHVEVKVKQTLLRENRKLTTSQLKAIYNTNNITTGNFSVSRSAKNRLKIEAERDYLLWLDEHKRQKEDKYNVEDSIVREIKHLYQKLNLKHSIVKVYKVKEKAINAILAGVYKPNIIPADMTNAEKEHCENKYRDILKRRR